MIEVGVYRAFEYTGREALRILNEHPQVKITRAISRKGKPMEKILGLKRYGLHPY